MPDLRKIYCNLFFILHDEASANPIIQILVKDFNLFSFTYILEPISSRKPYDPIDKLWNEMVCTIFFIIQ